MKLRLMNGGFENYTGQMGVVDFVDGLSTGDVLPIDGTRFAALFGDAVWLMNGSRPEFAPRGASALPGSI